MQDPVDVTLLRLLRFDPRKVAEYLELGEPCANLDILNRVHVQTDTSWITMSLNFRSD